jgi:hypothetical protein
MRLLPMGFWRATANGEFGAPATDLFESAIRTQFSGENASGEDADFWRRVLYDVRKVHHLIYHHEFAEAILHVIDNPDCGELLTFLRSGQLMNQKNWRGVLGQSAGVPLFFVVRELRRLGVITHSEIDASCFFVCKPVRRVARHMGWIEEREVNQYRFDALHGLSERLFTKYTEDEEYGKRLLQWFDIPLLHYAQTELGS